MEQLGVNQLEVNVAERKYVQELALRRNQTSKRSTNMSMPLTHSSPRNIQFIMELETWRSCYLALRYKALQSEGEAVDCREG